MHLILRQKVVEQIIANSLVIQNKTRTIAEQISK